MTRDELATLLERHADGSLDRAAAWRLLSALREEGAADTVREELEFGRLLMQLEAEADGEVFRRSLVERLRAETDGDRFVATWRGEAIEDDGADLAAISAASAPTRRARPRVVRRRQSPIGLFSGIAAVTAIVLIAIWMVPTDPAPIAGTESIARDTVVSCAADALPVRAAYTSSSAPCAITPSEP